MSAETEVGYGLHRVHLLRPLSDWTLCGLRLGLAEGWPRRPFADDPCKVCSKVLQAEGR